MSSFEDEYFDWVYVDAEHSYEGVLRDAHAAAGKIRPGGFWSSMILPISIRIWGGMAFTGLLWTLHWKSPGHSVFFAFESSALYDVALQKPLVT